MAAITTISGHVSRALDVLGNTDMWIALAKPFDWNIARITSANLGPYATTIADNLVFVIDDTYTVTVTFASDISRTATQVRDVINAAATGVHVSLANIASVVANRVRITSPTLSTGKVEITNGNVALGFFANDTITAQASGIPSPNPETTRLYEPFAFEKIVTKTLVVPDADTHAVVVSGNQGNTFDTSVASSANGLTFTVDGSSNIVVVFPDSASTSLAVIVDYINDAAALISGDYAEVASIDASVSPPRLKLTSPTFGSTSLIDIISANPPAGLDIPTLASTTGTDGGAYRFRNDQFRAVADEDAYTEGARLVYVEAEFEYDEVPLTSWSQIGLHVDLTKAVGVPGGRTYLSGDEVLDAGVLEYLENRALTSRSVDQKELIRLVIEF